MRLKVGDIILDAYRDETIAQNYAVNQLGDIVTRQGSYSNDFELPLTAKNRDALGFPSDINSNSRKPYQKVSATLIDQGTPIAEGYLKYKATSNNNLRCSFFATNVEWFALIKDKKLTDINLSDFDHAWTIENIEAAIVADKSSGYTYPLIDYGEFGTVAPVGGVITVDGNQMFPAMFVHTIVEKMFFDIGWKVEGEMIDHPLYKRMIIPFSAKGFNNDETFIDQNKQEFSLPDGDQEFDDEVFPIPTDPVDWDWDYDVIVESPSTTEIDITDFGNYKTSVVINLTVSYEKNPFTTLGTKLFFPIEIKKNGVIQATIAGIDIPFGGGNTAELSGQYTFDYTAFFSPGDTIEIAVGSRVEITGADPGQPGNAISSSLTISGLSVDVEPGIEIAYGSDIVMSSILPDMTQEDLLKYLVFLFGAIPQANNNSKTVNFALFRSIKNNVPDALDWSDKIDLSKTRELDFTELLERYAQVSIMTYTEDEEDAELSAYEAETGKRLGEGQFDIQNEHLAARETIYEAPFSPMININSFNETFYIPQIRFKAKTVDDDDVEPVPKIAILSENISISTLTGGLFSILQIENPVASGQEVVNSLPFCWFVKTKYVSAVDSLLDSLAFDQVRFTNVVGEPIIDRFLVDYEDILNSVKYYKTYFHLTETDIANLDFTVPIFVDRLKSYFYISNIKNYQGSEQTTECELVKITKSVEDLQVLTPDNVFIDNDLIEFIDNDGEAFFDGP